MHRTDFVQPRKIRAPADGTKGWSPKALETLRGSWGQGYSCGQICKLLAQLDPPVYKTRNAVVGKAHRLGLAERATVVRKPRVYTTQNRADVSAQLERAREKRVKRTTVDTSKVKALRLVGPGRYRQTARDEVLKLPDIVEPSKTSILMCNADDSQCKWPASGDVMDMHVCGDPVVAGPYCAFHARRGYTMLPTKKRNARFFARQETDLKA
jgi:GcrA cell cycle regulator